MYVLSFCEMYSSNQYSYNSHSYNRYFTIIVFEERIFISLIVLVELVQLCIYRKLYKFRLSTNLKLYLRKRLYMQYFTYIGWTSKIWFVIVSTKMVKYYIAMLNKTGTLITDPRPRKSYIPIVHPAHPCCVRGL